MNYWDETVAAVKEYWLAAKAQHQDIAYLPAKLFDRYLRGLVINVRYAEGSSGVSRKQAYYRDVLMVRGLRRPKGGR